MGRPVTGSIPGSCVPLTDTLTSIPAFSPSLPLGLPLWVPLCWLPGLLLEEPDEEDDEEDCEPGRLELGRLAVLPPWLELVEPGNDGVDEPLEPELLVLGIEGLRELDWLELEELDELELELDELGLLRDEEELLLGEELDDGEPDEEAVGIDEDEELLDELCCSSHPASINPKVVATTRALMGLRCNKMLMRPPDPRTGAGQLSSAFGTRRSTPGGYTQNGQAPDFSASFRRIP